MRQRTSDLDILYTGLTENFLIPGAVATDIVAQTDPEQAFAELKAEYEAGKLDEHRTAQLKRVANLFTSKPILLGGVPHMDDTPGTRAVFGQIMPTYYSVESETPQTYGTKRAVRRHEPRPENRLYDYGWIGHEVPHGGVAKIWGEDVGSELPEIRTEVDPSIQNIGDKIHAIGQSATVGLVESLVGVDLAEEVDKVLEHFIAYTAATNEFSTFTSYVELHKDALLLGQTGVAAYLKKIYQQESKHFGYTSHEAEYTWGNLGFIGKRLSKQIIIRKADFVGVGGEEIRRARVGNLLMILARGKKGIPAMLEPMSDLSTRLLPGVKITDIPKRNTERAVEASEQYGFDSMQAVAMLDELEQVTVSV